MATGMRNLIILCGLQLILVLPAFGADIYIAQNTTGVDTGANCANAHSASWFNVNATGGNNYHLCGTFDGTAGQTMFTVPASGSAGSPLVIQFETGAVLTAPYWSSSGAIAMSNKSYVTIDGGTNGVIKNTANGTALTYQQSSLGVYVADSNHIEIKNLTIRGIYANGGSSPNATDTGGKSTADISLAGSCNNIFIHNNVLDNAKSGISYGYSGTVDKILIYNNTIRDHCWSIAVGANTGTPTITNVEIYNNEITGWLNWQCPANASFCTDKNDVYHTDGIILWQTRGGTFSPKIYNNYIHGSLGSGSATGYIFCTYGSGTVGDAISCQIYNNVLINDAGFSTPIWIGGANVNTKIYNNTIRMADQSGSAAIQIYTTGAEKNISIQNNIIWGGRLAYQTSDGGYAQYGKVDYNLYYMINSSNDPTGNSWRGWGIGVDWAYAQSLGFEIHSIKNSNPKFVSTTDFHLQATSPAINKGSILSSVFTTDYAGTTRNDTGWDIGAYAYTGRIPMPPEKAFIRQ